MDNNLSKNSSKIPEPVKQVIGIIGVLEEALAEGARKIIGTKMKFYAV